MKNSGSILIIIAFLFMSCQQQKENYLIEGQKILKQMGETGVRNGGIKKANDFFKRALEENPNLLEAQLGLAFTYSYLHKPDKAKEVFDNSIKSHKNALGKLLQARGMQKFIDKDYDASIDDFQESLLYHPDNKEIYEQIVFSIIFKKYRKNGEWNEFEKMDISNIIDEVYPVDIKKISVEEFVNRAGGSLDRKN